MNNECPHSPTHCSKVYHFKYVFLLKNRYDLFMYIPEYANSMVEVAYPSMVAM
jgi:hypothetical protein